MEILEAENGKQEWSGTATQLLGELEVIAETLRINIKNSRIWPRSPNGLSRRINEVKTTLREVGYEVEQVRNEGKSKSRGIKIRKISSLSSTSSIDQKHEGIMGYIGGYIGDDIDYHNQTSSPSIHEAIDGVDGVDDNLHISTSMLNPSLLLAYYDMINKKAVLKSQEPNSIEVYHCKNCQFQTSSRFDFKYHDSNSHGRAWS